MNLPQILAQARAGRPDLAALNLAASGFSAKALRVIARHKHSSGKHINIRVLHRDYRSMEKET